MSRSVMTPTSLSPSTIGMKPIPNSRMRRATSRKGTSDSAASTSLTMTSLTCMLSPTRVAGRRDSRIDEVETAVLRKSRSPLRGNDALTTFNLAGFPAAPFSLATGAPRGDRLQLSAADAREQILQVAVGPGNRAVDETRNLPARLGGEPGRDALTNLAPRAGIAHDPALADLVTP